MNRFLFLTAGLALTLALSVAFLPGTADAPAPTQEDPPGPGSHYGTTSQIPDDFTPQERLDAADMTQGILSVTDDWSDSGCEAAERLAVSTIQKRRRP